MRIQFRVDGGFAALPGFNAPVSIECDTLPPAREAQLRDLVQRADFFTRPEAQAGAPMPDARSFTITVDDGPRCRTMTVHEPIGDPALRDLVAEVRGEARKARERR
jgi:2-methylcitrate dehydratase PrpD